ncbi:MAG: glycosyl transferase family 90 [Rikenellaceae bacterium]
MTLRYLLNSGKNSKLKYYAMCYLRYAMPRSIYQHSLDKMLQRFNNLSSEEQQYIEKRVNYYCKLDPTKITHLEPNATTLGEHKLQNKKGYHSPYFFDTYEYTRYFDDYLKWSHLFGDITHSPPTPMIVKSRPIGDNNENSVVMKLNKNRHFIYVNDSIKFEDKSNSAIFRGDIMGKDDRRGFITRFIDHPMCDIGVVSHNSGYPAEWRRKAMSIYEHLTHKFVFALEGNDVASNLKWVMSSNSLAIMPRPTCETWFMEGTLKGGEHFVEIERDFSNLESQMQYYIDHPKEAKEISNNANRYVDQFKDSDRETLISLLVLVSYFERTGQL